MATDLYIGYMDEEVASLLKVLLARYPDREFRVFERGLVEADTKALFERPIAEFTTNPTRAFSVAYHDIQQLFKSKGKSGSHKDLKYGEYLRRRLRDRTDETQEVKFYSSVISELTFARAGDEDDGTVYVIRAPEMGKQPGLTRIYLRLIIRYLKDQRKVNEMNVGCYGTGGGIVPGSTPGLLQQIAGSVFVGPDIDEKGHKFANVEFIYWDRRTFQRKSPLAQTNHGPLEQQAEEIFYGDPMPLEIREIFRKHPKLEGSVSATFSYFDGSDTKRAVDRVYNNLVLFRTECKFLVGKDDWKPYTIENLAPAPTRERCGANYIVNSNMEDYHIFRVLSAMTGTDEERGERNYPKLTSAAILRVAANVVASPQMEKVVEDYINDGMFDVTLTRKDYEFLVAWGKKGLPLTEDELGALPKVAYTWHEALNANNELLQQLLVFHFEKDVPVLGYSEQLQNYCLEPFCVEIATDFAKAGATLPENDAKLWLRGGNKWEGILRATFLTEENIKDIREKLLLPKNLDRILYKSSGAPALQIQALAAVELFARRFD
jgi:hypothetical protein